MNVYLIALANWDPVGTHSQIPRNSAKTTTGKGCTKLLAYLDTMGRWLDISLL
jgi:hypothetical protein